MYAKKLAAVALAGTAFFAAHTVEAAQRVEVCARQGSGLLGHAYDVEATVATGEELNYATNSLRFTYYRTYVVIFWAQDQASIIKMDLGAPSYFPSGGTDQEGRHWEVFVMGNALICY